MSWEKKEGLGRIVKMSDAADAVQEIEGIYLGTVYGHKFPDRPLHAFRTSVSTGSETISTGGNTQLNEKLTEQDVGKLVKLVFDGWYTTKGGRNAKSFSVMTHEGVVPPELAAEYPSLANTPLTPLPVTKAPRKGKQPIDELHRKPDALEPEDDDLPF